MSQPTPYDFSQFVPGFDFLKKLSSTNTQSLPQASTWVAPTLDPQEIEKRIKDLKTVQFWLEQNTQAVAATIQALEVQRMTLSTLQGMNVSINQLTQALQVKADHSPEKSTPNSEQNKATQATPPVDPMAWWNSLTQQFQQIADTTMKEMKRNADQQASQTPKNNKTPDIKPVQSGKPADQKASVKKTTAAKTVAKKRRT
jgi:hypothetical protein